MRRRLINSTLAVVLVVIAVFGVSLVIVETRTIQSGAQESVASEAVRLVGIVESRLGSGEKITPDVLSEQITAKRHAEIKVPGKPPIEIGQRPAGEVIQSTVRGDRGESVTVQESRSTISSEVGRTLLVILAVALLAILAAVVLAVRQARRLTAPLTDLAETAERLGSGDPARATAVTACRSSTGSPMCWTPAPSGSRGCSPPSGGWPRTPRISCVRR